MQINNHTSKTDQSQPLLVGPAPDATHFNWRTLNLPLAQQLDQGDEINDASGQAVLKVLNTTKIDKWMFVTAVKVTFCNPGSSTAVACVERDFGGVFDHFDFTKYADTKVLGSHDIHGNMEKGPFGAKMMYNKEHSHEDIREFLPELQTMHKRVPMAILCCGAPFMCKKYIFKFYAASNPKQLVMVRNQEDRTLEFGPDVSIEEAVSVAYAVDWMTLPCKDKIFRRSSGRSAIAAALAGAIIAVVSIF